jgi:hypothetical protein
MITILSTVLALPLSGPMGDPIPPPREKEVFRFTVQTNTLTGFKKASQLNLERDGKLYANWGHLVPVPDDDLGAYCISDPEKEDQKLVLLVVKPGDISAGKLVLALERIEKAASKQKVHLTVSVLTRSPAR